MRRLGLAAVVLAAWGACFFPALPAAGGQAFERVSRAYETISDLRGRFRQTSEMPELDRTETAEGTFRAILPDHLRWDYERPRRQVTELQGVRLKIRQEGGGETYEGVVDEARYGSAPMTLLMGPGVFGKDFVITEPSGDTLELRPKKEIPGLTLIRMFLAREEGFPLARLEVVDVYGNRNTFVFTGVKVNTGLEHEDLAVGEKSP